MRSVSRRILTFLLEVPFLGSTSTSGVLRFMAKAVPWNESVTRHAALSTYERNSASVGSHLNLPSREAWCRLAEIRIRGKPSFLATFTAYCPTVGSL